MFRMFEGRRYLTWINEARSRCLYKIKGDHSIGGSTVSGEIAWIESGRSTGATRVHQGVTKIFI